MSEWEGSKTHLIRMMLQTLLPIRLLNLHLRTLLMHTQNLVIILRLAPLQRHFRLLQLLLESSDVSVCRTALCTGLSNGGFEIGDGSVVFFEVEVDASAGAECFEGVR
jgi:hypothetical protein